jgi:hypothetical protein
MSALRGLAQLKVARSSHVTEHGTEPTGDELAAATGFTDGQLESLLAMELTPRGLEEPVSDDYGATATFGQTMPDPAGDRRRPRCDRRRAGQTDRGSGAGEAPRSSCQAPIP